MDLLAVTSARPNKEKFKVLNIDNLSYAAQRYNLRDIKSKTIVLKGLI